MKEHLLQLHPQLEELRKKKDERLKQFEKVKEEIHGILVEIAGSVDIDDSIMFSSATKECLSLRKLNDFISHLHTPEREKGDCSKIVDKYVDEVHSLTFVMALDCGSILSEVHPMVTKITK